MALAQAKVLEPKDLLTIHSSNMRAMDFFVSTLLA